MTKDTKEKITDVLASGSEEEVHKHMLREVLDHIKATSGVALLKVNEAFQHIVSNMGKVLKSSIEGTKAFFKDLPETVRTAASTLYNSMIRESSKIWKSMKDGAKATVGVIRNAFSAVLNKLAKVFEATSNLIGEGKTALLAEVSKIRTSAGKFSGKVKRVVGKAVSKLKSKRGRGHGPSAYHRI